MPGRISGLLSKDFDINLDYIGRMFSEVSKTPVVLKYQNEEFVMIQVLYLNTIPEN
jgi:hypothetical protein